MRPSVWYYWLHWRPTFWDDMTPEEDAALGPHSDYVGELYDQGRVVLAGGVREPAGGVVFFRAANRQEAEAIMNKEPLVQSGIVEITLHQLKPGFIGATPFDYREGDSGDFG